MFASYLFGFIFDTGFVMVEAQKYKGKEETELGQVDRAERNWKSFQQGIGHMPMFEVMGDKGHLTISKKHFSRAWMSK